MRLPVPCSYKCPYEDCGRIEATGHCQIEVLFRNFLGGTEENREARQPGELVAWPRLKPGTIIRRRSVFYKVFRSVVS